MGAPPRRRAPSTAWHWARLCVRKSGLWVATALVSRACAFLAHAQTTTTFYLHGTGPNNNPPTLFLNTTVPIASAKTPTLAEVCWRRALPFERNGVDVVGLKFFIIAMQRVHRPTSGIGIFGHIALGVLLLSGLLVGMALAQTPNQPIFGPKNYQFPHFVAVESFTVPSAVGAPFALQLVNGDPNGTHRVSAAFVFLNSAVVVTPQSFNQNVANLTVSVTLKKPQTNTLLIVFLGPPGSHFTLAALGSPTVTQPTALTPNPLNLTIGATGTLTATLSLAPTVAGTLGVVSGTPSAATVPASVNFGIGQTSVPILVTAVGTGNSQITVSLNGGTASSTVQVTPAAPTITSLAPPTLTITQGATSPLTVTISSAQLTDTVVSVTSSASSIASVPGTVMVLAGQTTAPIPVSANTPGTAQITASLNGTSASSLITVTPTLPTVVSLLSLTNPVNLGGTVTLTVTISAAQPADTTVALSASPGGIVTVPPSVTVLANQTTATFNVGTAALGTALVTASLNSTSASASVQVTPPPPALAAFTPAEQTIAVGATGTLTFTLNAAQTTPTVVTLSVDAGSILQVPSSVTVPQNQLSASFTVTGLAVGDATVTATVTGSSRTALVHVVPPPPVAVSLLPSTQAIQQGANGTLTFTLTPTQLADTTVPLTKSNSAVLQVPSSVTVPAGQTSAPIIVTGLVPGGPVTVSATLGGVTVSATVAVTPPPTLITGITPATLSLPKGKPGTLRVTVSPAPPQATDVLLTSSDPSRVTVPPMVAVPAGALFADFVVTTPGEGSAVITASLNGSSATATGTVTPAEVVLLTLAPKDVTVFAGESQAFTATGTYTDGSTQNLTSQVTWTSSDQAIATINSSGLATSLIPGATTITVSITNPSGLPLVTASTTLTVLTPPPLEIVPPSASLQEDETLALSIQSVAPADVGGLVITITQGGTGSVIVPATVTMPEGQNTVPVNVMGATAGSVTLTATAIGRQPGTAALTVTPAPPSITSFAPLTGPIGTTVTITGKHFASVTANNQVKFNGKPAILSAPSATSIMTTVPQGATTGPITVTTPIGTATSAIPFTVTGPDFTISALPAPLAISSVGQSAFAVSLNGTGGFTNLATLSVSGAPAGLTATFSAATLTMGQSAFLTITTNGTTAAGVYPLTINAVGLVNGVQTTRSTTANIQVGGAGATTLSGQVLDEDAKSVKGALVKLGALQASTDEGGNFLLQNPPAGVGQLLFIDGGPASTPTHNLPIIPYKVTIVAGQDNPLGFTVYMHFQKTTGLVDISNSAVERSVTDPEIPGFEMKIPAGATIIGWDGQPNTQISVRRVPIDRLPLPPMPPDRYAPIVYMDYFNKPGGGTPSEPIPITLPNDVEADPGTQVELWFYDEAPDGSRPNQWAQYGTGTVSADGSRIVPDLNPATGKPYGQPRFCCGGMGAALAQVNAPNRPGAHGAGQQDGDPVDLPTGLFMLQKTDLTLPGRLPVSVTRFYRTNDPTVGSFGRGTSHGYDVQLFVGFSERSVLLPNGARIIFAPPPQPDGTYRNTNAPAFRGAVITQTFSGHTLRFKDGTTWTFVPGTSSLFLQTLASQADRNGNTITVTRTNGVLTGIVDSAGRTIAIDTAADGRITKLTDPIGRTVTYTYDNGGRLVSVRDPEFNETRYSYDVLGRLATLIDGRGITFLTNEYDSAGRVIRQTQADGGVWQFAYSVTRGVVTQTTVTDPQGHQRTTRFNGIGYDLGRTDGQGQTGLTARDSFSNLVTATTDPLGRATAFENDANGNVAKIIDPALHETRFTYDAVFHRVTTITDALTQVTEFTYDAQGNLLTTKDPLTHTTTITYNAFGQPTSVQGPIPSEPPTTFAYDTNGNLITTTDPLGNVTQRAYDTVSRLISLTDPRGLTTLFRYDGLNRVTEIADAAQGLTRFGYDPNGNLLQVQDTKNQTTTYTYDSTDRLATRKDALNRQESYQYDPAGNLSLFTDRKNQTTTISYDSLNRRIGASYADGSTTSFIYDSVGRLTKAADSLVGAIDFLYDNLDRLVKEVSAQGVVEYAYDAIGRRTTMTANGATPVSYGYDAASRLIQVAQAGLVVGLGYDNANRRTSLTYPNGTSTSYSYDNASRLTTITHNGPAGLIESLSYVYDAAGNRISLARASGAATLLPQAIQAAYDAANEQIQFNNASPNQTFDANGNLTSDGTNTYTWDARDRLTTISGPGLSANFVYDAQGRRISKTVNGVTTQYLYDGKNIVQEIGGSAVGASYVRSLNIDEAFIRQMASENEFYHNDALGSALALSNSAGATAVSYSYEAFGKTTATGNSSNSFQYTGRENDSTALVYYRARYYSPVLQRFLSEDPIGFNGGINLYAYVVNNPINRTDPFGLVPQICCRGVTGLSAVADHCYIKPDKGATWSLRDGGFFGSGPGVIDPDYDKNKGGDCEECKPKGCKDPDKCFARVAGQYQNGGRYNFGSGPNSNTFAARLANACCDGGFPNKFKRRAFGSEADPPFPKPPNDMR